MIPWKLIGEAKIPGGGALRLKQRGDEFSILLGTADLMNSRLSGSEEALATLACARLTGRPQPRLLIGGLGMGFTLRAALSVLTPDARIIVAELVPDVVAWARGPLAPLFGASLQDPRVTIVIEDVGATIRAAAARYDAILLDVDNGPEGLTLPSNDRIYGQAGLRAARAALRPGGLLAVWSCCPDTGFTARLRRAGFRTEEVRVRADRGRRGARHTIWLAEAA